MIKKVVKGTPTKSGNGFKVGEVYTFVHVKNNLYKCTIGDLERFEVYPFGETSAHLKVNGDDKSVPGKFEEIE